MYTRANIMYNAHPRVRPSQTHQDIYYYYTHTRKHASTPPKKKIR